MDNKFQTIIGTWRNASVKEEQMVAIKEPLTTLTQSFPKHGV